MVLLNLQAHQVLYLLRHCVSLPKLLYILRCPTAWTYPENLKEFDECIRQIF